MASKNKKIKNLKKIHIWPTIIMMFVMIIISFAVAIFFVVALIQYMINTKFESNYDTTVQIAEQAEELLVNVSPEGTLDYLKTYSDKTDALYLVNNDTKEEFGFGENSVNQSKSGLLNPDGYRVYLDNNSVQKLIKIENNQLVVNFENFPELNVDNPFDIIEKDNLFDSDNKGEAVLSETYWLGKKIRLENGNYTVFVHHRIDLYNNDIVLCAIFMLVSGFITFIPVIFLVFSLINNAVNHFKLRKMFYTDTVTGGKNWDYLEHTADKTLKKVINANKTYAIVDITLMKYRNYCAYHGADAGVLLLQNIDSLINKFLKKHEICCLYGKSSFAVFIECNNEEAALNRISDLVRQISEKIDPKLIFHSGVFFIDKKVNKNGKIVKRHHADISDYYNRASAARASIEDKTSTSTVVFSKAILDKELWEHRIAERMQIALDNEEFKVYIQPKYNPVTEKLAGAEALVRWINDEDGFVSPGKFIPVFEKNGFIIKLDDYMISHVAKLQSEWISQGRKVVPVSVNVSRAHFGMPDLAKHICELVDQYNTPHEFIEIELTESAFFDDKAVLLKTVGELKNAGFDISMDDFGAGYSSLNSLKDLPLDVLKLDAEFFRGDDNGARGEIVVSQAIDLAKKLNMRIVAEGIEKKEQVDFLASAGCDMIQGFYFAKPMPSDEYCEKMELC